MIKLTAQAVTVDAAPGDTPTRTITGIAVPYGETATVNDGTRVRFEAGSLPVDGKAPKLFMYHDSTQPVGLVTARQDTDAGMLFSARISGTAAGDEALTLALDGVLDAVSVGVNPTRFSYDDEGTMIVAEAEWLELSLVPIGAFAGAEIVEVYASAENTVLASATEPGTTEPTPTEVEETEQVDTTPETENTIEAAAIPTAPIPAQPKRQFAMPSPGEYMAAFHIGGDTFRRVNEAYVEAAKSKQTALQAAAGDVLTTDTPGLLPVPVLGPVFENLNQSTRPVVAAVGARAMPDGGSQKTFIRPTWTTHTSVGAQANELTAVSATTPVIASNTISKTTIAGQVTLSVQDIDFTSPASLDIILNDLVGQYFRETDNFIADKMVADAGVSGVTWTFAATDPTDLLDALYDVAESQLTATNFLPDHLFVSPDVWKKLSSQLDGDNRPVFPYVAAAGLMGINGFGTQNITTTSGMNPFGLNLVVDNQFASGTMILAQGRAIEFYEQVRGIQSVEQPSLLGRTFSYYGYVAGFIANTTLVSKIAVA
jgi:HK97 family phage prohead protease